MAFLLMGLLIGFAIGVMYQKRKIDNSIDPEREQFIDDTLSVARYLKQQLDVAEWQRDAAMALYRGTKQS